MQWTRTLPSGRRIQYTYEGFEGGPGIVGAYVEGDVVGIAEATTGPMTREEVEAWAQAYVERARS